MKVFNHLKTVRPALLDTLLVVAMSLSTLGVFASDTAAAPSNDKDAICGIWYTNNQNSKVEIFNSNGSYFGKIIWLKDPGKSMYNNKLVILDMAYNKTRKVWDSGTLYNPMKDAAYKGIIQLQNKDTLIIRAYLGSPLVGKTITWTRAK